MRTGYRRIPKDLVPKPAASSVGWSEPGYRLVDSLQQMAGPASAAAQTVYGGTDGLQSQPITANPFFNLSDFRSQPVKV